MNGQRILWIDTVKAIGMFFIVLGHFFPPYISAWIYTFNVPLFFFMSGFLGKKEDCWITFWQKNINGLVIPFLLLSLLINVPYITHNITDVRRMAYLVGGITFGFHSIDGMYGCLNMWFVYCLLMVKIMFQCTSNNRSRMALLVLCVGGMVAYHASGLKLKWAVSNVLYAYPYFVVGYWFKIKNIIKNVTANIESWQWNLFIVAIVATTGIFASHNKIAYTYEGGGGRTEFTSYGDMFCY